MIIKNLNALQLAETTDPLVAKGKGKVYRQPLMRNEESGVGVAVVKFSPGARLYWHTHSGEQILFVTEGKGIVATKEEEYVVTPGAIVYIPPGEVHWHGATAETSFTHAAVYRGNSKVVE